MGVLDRPSLEPLLKLIHLQFQLARFAELSHLKGIPARAEYCLDRLVIHFGLAGPVGNTLAVLMPLY
jgi:hypothetical protein